jgi:hypothetical protein
MSPAPLLYEKCNMTRPTQALHDMWHFARRAALPML